MLLMLLWCGLEDSVRLGGRPELVREAGRLGLLLLFGGRLPELGGRTATTGLPLLGGRTEGFPELGGRPEEFREEGRPLEVRLWGRTFFWGRGLSAMLGMLRFARRY